MPVLQKKALFSAFIICQVLRIIQNYMEVSPAKSLILSATIHGGSYFFIQPFFCTRKVFISFYSKDLCHSISLPFQTEKDASYISMTHAFLFVRQWFFFF